MLERCTSQDPFLGQLMSLESRHCVPGRKDFFLSVNLKPFLSQSFVRSMDTKLVYVCVKIFRKKKLKSIELRILFQCTQSQRRNGEKKIVLSFTTTSMNSDYKILFSASLRLRTFLSFRNGTEIILTNISGR